MIRAPSTVAERMRRHRRRRRLGRRLIGLEIDAAEVDSLINQGYLDAKDRDHLEAIEFAANAFFSDAVGGLL